MPLNQFDVKPSGNTYNESSSFSGSNGSNKYYDYYMSPIYKKLNGGIGAENSSYGLQATSNANRLSGISPDYERALGELAATLSLKGDNTSISKYVAPSRSYDYYDYSPSYISLSNVDKGSLYRLGDSNEEIAKAQAIMKANGYYDGDVTGVYDTATKNATINWKTDNAQSNQYGTTYGNETINNLNKANNKVTTAQFNSWYKK